MIDGKNPLNELIDFLDGGDFLKNNRLVVIFLMIIIFPVINLGNSVETDLSWSVSVGDIVNYKMEICRLNKSSTNARYPVYKNQVFTRENDNFSIEIISISSTNIYGKYSANNNSSDETTLMIEKMDVFPLYNKTFWEDRVDYLNDARDQDYAYSVYECSLKDGIFREHAEFVDTRYQIQWTIEIDTLRGLLLVREHELTPGVNSFEYDHYRYVLLETPSSNINITTGFKITSVFILILSISVCYSFTKRNRIKQK